MTQFPQTKGGRTRQAVMDAAREVILSQGYTAASMRKISDAVGITPSAIYNHFASKEALFGALLQEAVPIEEITVFFSEITADSAEALLGAVFRGLVTLFQEHEDYIRLALIDAQERDGATLITFVPRLFPVLMQFGQRLQALDEGNGRLRPISLPILIRTLISLIGGYLLTERAVHPQQSLNLPQTDWVSGLLDILMYGVFYPEP